MSLLNLCPFVTLQFIRKLNIVDRINLSRAHSKLSPLCFDRTLKRKYTETLTLDELRKLYEQSRTDNEREQCFKSNVFDRLLIKNVNEVVHLYMDDTNKQFLTNGKIFHSLKGKFILEGENFSETFLKQFLSLLERADGTLLVAFVNVRVLLIDAIDPIGLNYVERFARILSSKIERGQKVYWIDYDSKMSSVWSYGDWIRFRMGNRYKFTIFYHSFLSYIYTLAPPYGINSHRLFIDKRNSVTNTKELTAMIDGDSLAGAKQHLESVLALVEAAALPGGGRDITCDNPYCRAKQYSEDEQMVLFIHEPSWSKCAGCVLK